MPVSTSPWSARTPAACRRTVPGGGLPFAAAIACAATFLGACASAPAGSDELPAGGAWSFNGSVQAEHVMRSGPERVSENVSGVVHFLPDVVNVVGTHGSCTIPREDLRLSGGVTRLSCGDMRLVLSPGRGEVTIPIQLMHEVRAGCAEYRNDNRRGPCIAWNYTITTRTVRVTGAVSVFETGDF